MKILKEHICLIGFDLNKMKNRKSGFLIDLIGKGYEKLIINFAWPKLDILYTSIYKRKL